MAQPFNLWKMLGTEGDQINPAVMGQMAAQAEPTPAPQVLPQIPANYQAPQDFGAAPQPTLPAYDPSFQYALMLAKAGPSKSSPELAKQLAVADQNSSEALMRQRDEIQKQKEIAANYAKLPHETDFRALAGLSDSLLGSKLSPLAEATAPQSEQQKLLTQAKLQEAITTQTQGLTKDQLEYIKQKLQQQSYEENRTAKERLAKELNATKLGTSAAQTGFQGKRLEIMDKRLNQQIQKEARGTVNTDPMLKLYTPRLEGAAKIGELINAAETGKVVSNRALLGQLNAEVSRLETGSQSPGLNAAEKTELQDLKANFVASLNSAGIDLNLNNHSKDELDSAVDPRNINTIKHQVGELSGSYMKGIDSRMEFLKAGMTPEQRQIATEKHQSLIKTYSPRFGGWQGLEQEPQVTPQDQAAIDWAKQNPKDPRAQQILQLHPGVK